MKENYHMVDCVSKTKSTEFEGARTLTGGGSLDRCQARSRHGLQIYLLAAANPSVLPSHLALP